MSVEHLNVQHHGSVVMVTPLSDVAKEELEENATGPENIWLGNSLAVEPRMLDAFLGQFEQQIEERECL